MKVPKVLALAALAGVLLAAALARPHTLGMATANAGAAPNGAVGATIDNFAFTPNELRVKAGSVVSWTNKDDTPHTVTSDDGAFASPVMDTDQSFQFTFQKPGRFPYHCKLHPKMTGVVVVQ